MAKDIVPIGPVKRQVAEAWKKRIKGRGRISMKH
jgi:hypothetical protein